jgi:hypothetical protein
VTRRRQILGDVVIAAIPILIGFGIAYALGRSHS